MIESVTYEYQLIASGVLPLWAGLLLAVLGSVLVVWLITGELRSRKRQTVGVKILKVNRSIIVLILSLLLVQPVLYISRIKTQPGQLVLAVDRSRSMLRVDAFDATALLNLATMLRTTSLEGRPVAADLLNQHLAERRADLVKFRTQVAGASADLSQGIPVSPQAAAQIESQVVGIEAFAKLVQADLAQLVKTPIASLVPATQAGTTGPSTPASSKQDVMSLAERAASDLTDLASLLSAAKSKPLSAESADQIVKAYDQLLKSGDVASAALIQVQGQIDKQFLASMKPEAKKPLDDLAGKSRFEIAKLVAKQTAEDPVLSKSHRVVLADFDPLDANTASSHTDLYSVIDEALPKEDDAVLSGMVLFSDGQQNLPARPEVMRRLTGRSTPFIAAGVGSSQELPDIAVVDYQVPGVIQKDKKTTLIVKLKTQVPPDTAINLTLTQSDGKAIATAVTKPGPVTSQGSKATVSMDFRLPDAGQRVLTLTASMDKPDAAPENDSVQIPIYVLDHQARVLIVAQWPRWDMVYAIQAMSDRPVSVDTVFWGESGKPPARGTSKGSIPDSISAMKHYQLIRLDGPAFLGIKPEDAKLFEDYVTQEGGSLAVFDSDDKGSYASAMKWIGAESAVPTSKATDAVGLLPGKNADGYPLTHLAADSAQSRSIWSGLGKVRHVRTLSVHNDAALIVAAEGASSRADAQDAGAVDATVSLGFHGRGKVYRVGVADLFRTREWSGGGPMTRFLGGLVDDALIPLFATPDAKSGIYPPVPYLGSTALAVGAPGHLDFKPASGISLPLDLVAHAGMPGNAAIAEVGVASLGNFDLMQGTTQVLSSQSIRPLSTEDVDFQLDSAGFTRLAAQAGGKYLPLVDLPSALKGLAPATEKTVNVSRYELWNLPALLVILAAMFTLDWYLRRKSGLVL